MKIIYFGSSVPIKSIQSTLAARCLMGSKAVNQRESYILNLLGYAKSEGTNLTFVSTAYGTDKGPFRTQVIQDEGNEIVCLGYSGSKYLRHFTSYIAAFYWILRNYNHGDLAITYNFPPLYALPILIKKALSKRKLIIEFEDFYNETDYRHYFYGPFEKLGIKYSNAFIASSSGMEKYIRSRRKEAEVVVNGGYVIRATEEAINFVDESAAQPYTILYSGSLDEERGVNNLLESFQFNPSRKFNLMFSGSGPLADKIINAASLDERICYLGLLDDEEYLRIIDSVDICISSQWSSISVNFPSKITTYLSLGKIVLSTKIESLLSSPFAPLLHFYDDSGPNGLWAVLDCVDEHMMRLRQEQHERVELFNGIMDRQKREVQELISGFIGSN